MSERHDAAKLSEDLFDAVYPKNGLRDMERLFLQHQFDPNVDVEHLHPEGRVDVVAPLLKFVSLDRRSRVIRDVLALETPFIKATALADLAPYMGSFGKRDRTRLSDGLVTALGTLQEIRPGHFAVREVLDGIAHARVHGYLDANQWSRIGAIMADHPQLQKGLETRMGWAQQDKDRGRISSRLGLNFQHGGPFHYNEDATRLSLESIHEKYETELTKEGTSPLYKLTMMGSIAAAIHLKFNDVKDHEVNNAREALKNRNRERSRGDGRSA